MAKKEGFLNISIAWDEDVQGEDYITLESALAMLPDGVNADVYTWDDEGAPLPVEQDGAWVFIGRNWEEDEDDAESN